VRFWRREWRIWVLPEREEPPSLRATASKFARKFATIIRQAPKNSSWAWLEMRQALCHNVGRLRSIRRSEYHKPGRESHLHSTLLVPDAEL
jgi:hypothetical protein